MKAVVAAFNQEKALVGAFSVITNLRMDLFQALVASYHVAARQSGGGVRHVGTGEACCLVCAGLCWAGLCWAEV